jgi:small subunit ribosomal protein S4
MSKRNSSKYKLDRRMGENIWGRPKSSVNRRSYGPGQHGQRRKSKVSDFGIQLRAKQKLKGYYGDVTEKQFKRTYPGSRQDEGRYRSEPDRPARAAPRHGGLSRQVRADHLLGPPDRQPRPHLCQRREVQHRQPPRRAGDVISLGKKAKEMALIAEAQTLPNAKCRIMSPLTAPTR